MDSKAAVARAKREVQEETMDKAVKLLKQKYRELETAKTVVANIEREVTDLELRIEQDNV